MDALLTALANFGVGGIMAAAVFWFLRHLVSHTIPEMHKMHREEVDHLLATFQKTNDAICDRLSQMDRNLTQMDHNQREIKEELAALRRESK